MTNGDLRENWDSKEVGRGRGSGKEKKLNGAYRQQMQSREIESECV